MLATNPRLLLTSTALTFIGNSAVRTQCHLTAQLRDRFASVPTPNYGYFTVVSICTLLNDVLIAALSGAGQATAAVLATVSALVGVPAVLQSDLLC
jgi:hypothetical protein